MSTRPPLPRLPLSSLNLHPEQENFINDMVKLACDRLDAIVNDLSQNVIDMGIDKATAFALQVSLHALEMDIQAKLLEFDSRVHYGKSFIDCSREERKAAVQRYLSYVKHSALAAYRMEN